MMSRSSDLPMHCCRRGIVCGFLACLYLLSCSIAAAPQTVRDNTSGDNKRFQSLSKQGVRSYRQHEYAKAIAMFSKAVEFAESAGLSPEQQANVCLNLAVCQKESGDAERADLTMSKAERIFIENNVDNPALRIRLLRKRTDIEEKLGRFATAAEKQAELCKIYEMNIGRMVLTHFSELARLQDLERKAKHYQRSVEIGRELLGLMAKFRVAPNMDVFIRTNLTQGIALIFAGQVRQGCDHLQKMYEAAREGSPDLAAYAAAWLVHCANLDRDETQRAYWTKRLDAVAEASHRTTKCWLEGVERDAVNGLR